MKKPWIIVPAAGIGSRMQAEIPKQYLKLLDRPVLAWTIKRLLTAFPGATCVVPLAPDDPWWPTLVQQLPATLSTCVSTCTGGADRAASVLQGLMALKTLGATVQDWVLVHDAVRPCVPVQDLAALWQAVTSDNCSALLGMPVVDSLRRVNADQRIMGTVDRTDLWRAFTPQVFPWGILHEALSQANAQGRIVTDESEAVLQLGKPVAFVQGSEQNIKLTYPEDITRAEHILKNQCELLDSI